MSQISEHITFEERGLIDPQKTSDPALFAELNRIMVEDSNPKKRKRASGGNHKYTPEQQTEGAKLALREGNMKAAREMSAKLGFDINESTVRGWKTRLLEQMQEEGGPVDVLKQPRRGAPTKIPKPAEEKLKKMIETVHSQGKHVSSKTTIRMGKAIMKRLYPLRWSRMTLGKSWTQSLFRRMKWRWRKVTRAARSIPPNIAILKQDFLNKFKRVVKRHKIPSKLTINVDQIGSSLLPARDHTMAPVGSLQVPQVGKGDKRSVTAVVGSTVRGRLLPVQMIYKGTTCRCHPHYTFPESWHITQNLSHWSNSDSMLEWVKRVLKPYCRKTRKELGLPRDQKAVLVLDVFRPHLETAFIEACEAANVCLVFVPAGCTSSLQPLDADGGVNYTIKRHVSAKFDDYCFGVVDSDMNPDCTLNGNSEIDTALSVIKPLHAEWFTCAHKEVSKRHDLIRSGWEKTGLFAAFSNAHS